MGRQVVHTKQAAPNRTWYTCIQNKLRQTNSCLWYKTKEAAQGRRPAARACCLCTTASPRAPRRHHAQPLAHTSHTSAPDHLHPTPAYNRTPTLIINEGGCRPINLGSSRQIKWTHKTSCTRRAHASAPGRHRACRPRQSCCLLAFGSRQTALLILIKSL